MRVSHLLFFAFRHALPLCILSTIVLYLYPFFQGCAFPSPSSFPRSCAHRAPGAPPCAPLPPHAPFRLLALGDPQLEGDTSLPKPDDPVFPSIERTREHLRQSTTASHVLLSLYVGLADLKNDALRAVGFALKRVDLFGNDFYIAHIYRTLHWWTKPTHVTVLGDLLGSQSIGDEEHNVRSRRFWGRAFKGGKRVDDETMRPNEGKRELLGADSEWSKRVINVVGNHDIGYAGDIDEKRVERFERAFGKANWDVTFEVQPTPNGDPLEESQSPPSLHLVVLNSMNLDGPARHQQLQLDTYEFMNSLLVRSHPVEDRRHGTVLLTHIPMHKAKGVCVDEPYFSYFDEWDPAGSGIKEQNHLSPEASQNAILEGILGLSGYPGAAAQGRGRHGIVLTGHDHEGCDVYHHIRLLGSLEAVVEGEEWNATRWSNAGHLFNTPGVNGVREVTVRSMMGSYGGNAGLLSAWFDEALGEHGEWRFEYAECKLGVQHIWWTVHVADIVVLIIGTLGVTAAFVEGQYFESEIKNKTT